MGFSMAGFGDAYKNNGPYRHGTFLIVRKSRDLIYFDCVISETVTRDADITEFPVEVGANISDHYRLKLTGVKLEIFVSQEPITKDEKVHPDGGGFWGAQALDFAAFPYPKLELSLATVGKALVNPVGSVVGAISGALSGDPRKVTMETLQFSGNFDSLESLLGTLDAVRESASLVNICTKSQVYDGFAIGEVTTSRDKDTGTGTKVSIAFHRVIQVQTGTVEAPPAPTKPKDKTPVNKGAQQPADPGDKESVLSQLGTGLAKLAGFGS